MTESEAADRLGVTVDAAPPEIARNYQSLRKQIQERLDDAPTDGLKRKYQAELQSLQQAFETLSPSKSGGNDYPSDEPSFDDETRDPTLVQLGEETPAAKKPPSSRWLLPVASTLLVCLLGALGFGYVKSHFNNQIASGSGSDPTRVSASTGSNNSSGLATSTRVSNDGSTPAPEQSQLQADQEQQAQALKAAQDRAVKAEQDAAAARSQAAAGAKQAPQQAEAEQAQADRDAPAKQAQAAQIEAERKAQADRDAEAAKPKIGSIEITAYQADVDHAGDCKVQVRVKIGTKLILVTRATNNRASGVPLGEQSYSISGMIACPSTGICQASGSGSLDLKDGDAPDLSWETTGNGECTAEVE